MRPPPPLFATKTIYEAWVNIYEGQGLYPCLTGLPLMSRMASERAEMSRRMRGQGRALYRIHVIPKAEK